VQLNNLDVVQILQIGVIGLGFLLALLAFWLLRKEQSKTEPHPNILKQITIFMAFSISLCVLGLLGNLIPKPETQDAKKTKELQAVISQITDESYEIYTNHLKAESESAQALFSSVCAQKRFNCKDNTTAESEKSNWRQMSPVEQQVCRLACD